MTNTARYFSSIQKNTDLKSKVLSKYNESQIEEFLVYDVLNQNENSTRAISTYDPNDPMITLAYPSFSFFDESFEDHLDSIDFTVIIDENFPELDSLNAFDINGNPIKILNYFDEGIRYQVIKYSEEELAINLNTMTDYFGNSAPSSIVNFTPIRQIGDYSLFALEDYGNAQHQDDGQYLFGPSSPSMPLDTPIILPPPDDPPCYETTERTLKEGKDVLHRIRFSSKSCLETFESGFHLPKVELIVTYAIVSFNPSSTTINVQLLDKTIRLHYKYMTPDFSDPLNLEIIEWNYPTMGDVWQVVWIERDYWNKVEDEFTLGYTWSIKIKDPETDAEASHSATIGYKIKQNKNDKKIGASLLDYCDPVLSEGYLGVDGVSGYKPYSCNVTGGFWFREIIEQ